MEPGLKSCAISLIVVLMSHVPTQKFFAVLAAGDGLDGGDFYRVSR
jgi:hypothetical protein